MRRLLETFPDGRATGVKTGIRYVPLRRPTLTTGDNNGLIALFEAALAARFEGPCCASLDSAEARRLRDHIESLSSAHRITVVEREMQWVDAWGEPDARKIVVPPLGSELAYFVPARDWTPCPRSAVEPG